MKQDTRTNQHYDELHLQIQDMLAGYVDNALEEQEKQIVEAHLAGCDDCRRDVARQQLLAKRLQDIPGSRLSAQAHQKLDQLFDDDLSQGLASSRTKQIKSPWFYPAGLFSPAKATLAVGGLVMLLMLVTSLLLPSWKKPNSSVVPMVQDVVTEYRQLSHTQLPITSARNQQMPPATWQNARVIANWKTNIGGAPAEAFAVRYGNNIVFQYRTGTFGSIQ